MLMLIFPIIKKENIHKMKTCRNYRNIRIPKKKAKNKKINKNLGELYVGGNDKHTPPC